MTETYIREYLTRLTSERACDPAVQWWMQYDTMQAGWDACERPDWMYWLLGRAVKDGSPEHRLLKLCAIENAESGIPHAGEGADLVRRTCDVARRYIDGKATLGELRAAEEEALAESAAWGAACAARAACAADATWAARAAAWAAAWAAGGGGQCDIIRRHFPQMPGGA